jgi:plasmid stabilization system protein ParE
MKCHLGDAASAELLGAVRHYALHDRRLGLGFEAEFQRLVSLVADNPRLGSPLPDGYRRILMRRFPDSVIYRIDTPGRLIRIVAIVDQRRRPGIWRTRVEEARAVYEVLDRAA